MLPNLQNKNERTNQMMDYYYYNPKGIAIINLKKKLFISICFYFRSNDG